MSSDRTHRPKPSVSHHQSQDSRVFDGTALLLPEGDIGASTSDLAGHLHEETLVDDENEPITIKGSRLPWYRRPSPWWIIGATPFVSIAMGATIAPRLQIYTRMACMVHRPEYMSEEAVRGIGLSGYWDVPALVITGHEPASNMSVPSPSQKCQDDPVVVAAVAALAAVMSITMGVLGCITTAWWGSLSDRWGRTKVMRFVLAGMLFADFNFILVARFTDYLPGGYWFLIMSSLVDGLLGGMSTASSTMHAYVSDCVEPMHRSRIFSLSTGLLFTGMAVGPTLGGLLVHYTGDLLSVFYMATAVHIISSILWIAFVPESLSEDIRSDNARKYVEEAAVDRAARKPFHWRRIFAFLRPLQMLLPQDRDPLNRRKGKDWNFTFVAAANACTALLMASYLYKMQYAGKMFRWETEEMSYWLSVMGVVRATFLLVILPVLIKLFKPVPESIRLDGDETDLTAPTPEASRGPSRVQSRVRPSTSRTGSLTSLLRGPHMAHPGAFDLYLARASLGIDIVSYAFAMIATTGPQYFAATLVTAFGGGFTPAVNSLALLLGGGRENGKMFGALSVLHVLASQVFGQALFAGTMYVFAGIFIRAIFLVSILSLAGALTFTMLIRLPPISVASYHRAMGLDGDREATLVGSSSGGTVKHSSRNAHVLGEDEE